MKELLQCFLSRNMLKILFSHENFLVVGCLRVEDVKRKLKEYALERSIGFCRISERFLKIIERKEFSFGFFGNVFCFYSNSLDFFFDFLEIFAKEIEKKALQIFFFKKKGIMFNEIIYKKWFFFQKKIEISVSRLSSFFFHNLFFMKFFLIFFNCIRRNVNFKSSK